MGTKKQTSLLDHFLGEEIVLFVKDMDSEVQTEEGQALIPLVCEGFFKDYDESFIMLTDEYETSFCLVAINSIVKIDNKANLVMNPIDKVDPGQMN